jgi:hypothetical protein
MQGCREGEPTKQGLEYVTPSAPHTGLDSRVQGHGLRANVGHTICNSGLVKLRSKLRGRAQPGTTAGHRCTPPPPPRSEHGGAVWGPYHRPATMLVAFLQPALRSGGWGEVGR